VLFNTVLKSKIQQELQNSAPINLPFCSLAGNTSGAFQHRFKEQNSAGITKLVTHNRLM
jgi:hypothetical protein